MADATSSAADAKLLGVKMPQGLADHPERHRIRVRTQDAEPQAISLVYRGAASHERVCYHSTQLVFMPIAGLQWFSAVVFRKKEGAEYRSGTAGEPFVYSYDWAIVLLYLLFPERESSGKRRVKLPFKPRRRLSSLGLYLEGRHTVGLQCPVNDAVPRGLPLFLDSRTLSHFPSLFSGSASQ